MVGEGLVILVQAVNVDPLQCLEWGEELAVVIAGEGLDGERVVHSVRVRRDVDVRPVLALRVGHPGVDPESAIDRVSIVDDHQLLTVFIVSLLG